MPPDECWHVHGDVRVGRIVLSRAAAAATAKDQSVVVVSPTEHYFGGIVGQTIDTRNFKTGGQVLDGGAGHDVLLSGKSASVLIGGPARNSIGRYLDFYNRRRPHS